MDRQILNITANEQILACDNPIKISTNKVNYIEAHFDLGTNWSGYDSVRAVWFNDFYCISTVLDSQGVCLVPFEVMKRNGFVKVNLVGSISENDVLTDRLTSYPIVAVIVDCTAMVTGAETSPITPSQFEQYVAIVRSLVNSVKDIDHIELNPDYTLTIYYSDGTSDTTTSIRGADGNGIQSITKTGTSGLVDTYTITFTDGNTTTFTVTNGAKGDTGNGIQSISKTSTVGLVDTYTITYTDGTTTIFTVTNGEKGDKGDTGEVSLSELEQATIVQTLSDTEPYNYRRTNGGNGAGHREYDEIVGASVGWNQLVKELSSDNYSTNSASVSYSNGIATLTPSGNYGRLVTKTDALPSIIAGHKYMISVMCKTNFTHYFYPVTADLGGGIDRALEPTSGAWTDYAYIFQPSTSVATRAFYGDVNQWYQSGDEVQIKNPQLTDLTLMLGSTIADYVYTLEQSTAGSGVAWLKSHFPKLFDNGYQPYDSGSIKSVSGLTAHEMVGKNLFNKDSITVLDGVYMRTNDNVMTNGGGNKGIILPIKGGYSYTLSLVNKNATDLQIASFKDVPANGSVATALGTAGSAVTLKTATVTTEHGDNYLFVKYNNTNVTQTYSNSELIDGLMVQIGSTATDFEPYEKHTYPLDSSVTLRGQYKLDANNNLYADGDVYPSSGEIGRNWGEDLLNGDWSLSSVQISTNTVRVYFGAFINRIKPNNTNVCNIVANFPCYQPDYIYSNDVEGLSENKHATDGGIWLRVNKSRLSTEDAAGVKAWLIQNPITLVYPLKTPTTETATPYTNPQWCDSYGTEEYVGSELPVGHNTDYPMALVDTMPTTNGTFEPRVTIANGKRTITWINV